MTVFVLRAIDAPDPARPLVAAYDPDWTPPGAPLPPLGVSGLVEWTGDLAEALQFVSFAAAMETWRMMSRYPVRADGRPNRPLTAYSVSVERVG